MLAGSEIERLTTAVVQFTGGDNNVSRVEMTEMADGSNRPVAFIHWTYGEHGQVTRIALKARNDAPKWAREQFRAMTIRTFTEEEFYAIA